VRQEQSRAWIRQAQPPTRLVIELVEMTERFEIKPHIDLVDIKLGFGILSS